MNSFSNQKGAIVVDKLIAIVQENKQYLSDIDGLIGDGDHGVNMNKGFSLCREDLDKNPGKNMGEALSVLSKILMMKIGGSMGPLYGKFFQAIAKAIEGKEEITQQDMKTGFENILTSIKEISPAQPGDKTLMDVIFPAVKAYSEATDNGKSLNESLDALKNAAIVGRDSTKDMVAKLGRASRLGERSRGVLDAGSVSCCLIFITIADTIKGIIK